MVWYLSSAHVFVFDPFIQTELTLDCDWQNWLVSLADLFWSYGFI